MSVENLKIKAAIIDEIKGKLGIFQGNITGIRITVSFHYPGNVFDRIQNFSGRNSGNDSSGG